MNPIVIPLILIMSLAIVLYTIGTFTGIKDKSFTKKHVILFHSAVLLTIIGLFYMSGISSKISYADVSYKMMNIHTGLGYLAVIILIIHAIIVTIMKRKLSNSRTSLGKGFNTFSFILWLICIILYLITFYIGIMAGMN
ncbi:hypothetical protein [uncultured Clostridium sp.]|jgi:uncharacterized repeat protein (TIGR03987 family)|uniref:hypothetical protein n=1 Tax=uncultured Clostridium sp. TaxID=59620 RepID=UPI00260D7063|nr:hypothetical protein [uncultured Clostridium sp.]